MVKFELLADRDDKPFDATFSFDNCEHLGAANLRGTKYAAEDIEVRALTAKVGDESLTVEVNVTGVAGFLLAKCAAAHSRRKPKDWYDIVFVLLHNDLGGPAAAANTIIEKFGSALGASNTALNDLAANFADPDAQGPKSYADQILVEHPDEDRDVAIADAIVSVAEFCDALTGPQLSRE